MVDEYVTYLSCKSTHPHLVAHGPTTKTLYPLSVNFVQKVLIVSSGDLVDRARVTVHT